MESFNNLTSLREMSESQVDALLRYDSPPETPQLVQRLSATDSEDKVKSDLFNSCILNNREQLGPQMDSQIDFSVFQNNSECSKEITSPWSFFSENSQDKTNEDSSFASTSSDCLINLSSHEIAGRHDKGIVGKSICNSIIESENENITEIDTIFKTIDFEYISNLEKSFSYKVGTPHCILQCQTEAELKPTESNINAKIISLGTTKTCYPSNTNELLSNISGSGNCRFSNEKDYDVFTDMHGSILQNKKQQTQNVCGRSFSFSSRNREYIKPTSFMADASLIPSSVKKLYDIVKSEYSDFAFIYAISSQLCQDRVPMECFVSLKMALLLSLASIGNNTDCPPIPIVAIGNDTYMTDYLMTNIGQLGTRFVGPTDDTKFSCGHNNWIEADSILLARGGIYYAGDWTRLKLRKAEHIFKNIECSCVSVDKSTLSYPLQTAIWTHWRSFKYNTKDEQTFNKFLKIFGMPVFVSDDNHEALVDYNLEQASIRMFESTVDHLSVNVDDMRSFLVCISQMNVDLSPEAALLLQRYFVASRSARQDCLTKQSYVILKQCAESFAKLSMRNEVLSDDALAAIILCEHFIENIFSPSDNPPPHFGTLSFVGAVDEYLIQFKQWLNIFLEKYASELVVNSE